MSHVLVRFKVADFKTWKPVFESYLWLRQKAGIKELLVEHNAENPNEIVILFEASDPDRAKAYAASDDLKRAMKEGGVLGPPEMTYLTAA